MGSRVSHVLEIDLYSRVVSSSLQTSEVSRCPFFPSSRPGQRPGAGVCGTGPCARASGRGILPLQFAFVPGGFLLCLLRWASVFSYFACGASAVADCLARLFDLKESQTDAQIIRTVPAFSSHPAKRRKANSRKTDPAATPTSRARIQVLRMVRSARKGTCARHTMAELKD